MTSKQEKIAAYVLALVVVSLITFGLALLEETITGFLTGFLV